MPDLAALTVEFFGERVGATFAVAVGPTDRLELLLTDAAAWGERPPDGRRQPFTVHFLGPSEPILAQRIYRLEDEDDEGTGAFELFIVPIGPDGDGIRYEAVFT